MQKVGSFASVANSILRKGVPRSNLEGNPGCVGEGQLVRNAKSDIEKGGLIITGLVSMPYSKVTMT
jgi:hypothetical protein